MLGTGTYVDGLGCSATGPASLQVQVAAGAIYAQEATDATAYGSLGTNSNLLMKQGLSLTPTVLSLTAPSTSGQSVNYLVQVSYSDVDANNQVLSYFNPANPSVPFTGPGNTGGAQPTVRQGVCVISLLAGTSAATGSQTTPAPSGGYTGLYVITLAYGQTKITNSQIVTLPNAPFLTLKLPAIAQSLNGHGKCQFRYISGTQVGLYPYGGAGIQIAGTQYAIPSGGIFANINSTYVSGVSATALAAGTVYWVYVFNNAGVLTLDFYPASSHNPDTTASNVGVEIRSGDGTRTLVGLVYTATGTAAYQDTATVRGVRSWFNRQPKPMVNTYGVTQYATGGTYAEFGSGACRLTFVGWADDIAEGVACGSMSNNVAGDVVQAAIGLNGTPVSPPTGQNTTGSIPIGAAGIAQVNEGLNYLALEFAGAAGDSGSITAGSGLYGRI